MRDDPTVGRVPGSVDCLTVDIAPMTCDGSVPVVARVLAKRLCFSYVQRLVTFVPLPKLLGEAKGVGRPMMNVTVT